MTLPRGHLDYVRDMIAMMDKIEAFTAGMTFDQFVQDDKIYGSHPRDRSHRRGSQARAFDREAATSASTVEEDGRNERQADPCVFWDGCDHSVGDRDLIDTDVETAGRSGARRQVKQSRPNQTETERSRITRLRSSFRLAPVRCAATFLGEGNKTLRGLRKPRRVLHCGPDRNRLYAPPDELYFTCIWHSNDQPVGEDERGKGFLAGNSDPKGC